MKSLRQYLMESERTYEFRMRTISDISDEQLDKLERYLSRYDVKKVGSPSKSILHKSPVGFGGHGPAEVKTIEIVTGLAVTPNVLHEEISRATGIPMSEIIVLTASESAFADDQEEEKDKKPSSLLADPDYMDAEKVNHEDYYGNDFVSKFVKELPKSNITKEYKV